MGITELASLLGTAADEEDSGYVSRESNGGHCRNGTRTFPQRDRGVWPCHADHGYILYRFWDSQRLMYVAFHSLNMQCSKMDWRGVDTIVLRSSLHSQHLAAFPRR